MGEQDDGRDYAPMMMTFPVSGDDDPELMAIEVGVASLSQLDANVAARVARYLSDRFVFAEVAS